jgi:hypothetical protein
MIMRRQYEGTNKERGREKERKNEKQRKKEDELERGSNRLVE